MTTTTTTKDHDHGNYAMDDHDNDTMALQWRFGFFEWEHRASDVGVKGTGGRTKGAMHSVARCTGHAHTKHELEQNDP